MKSYIKLINNILNKTYRALLIKNYVIEQKEKLIKTLERFK